jgi:hypothetical protein
MFPDVRFEAGVLRAALLLGLVREIDVQAWADALLATEPDENGRLADVALAPTELTAVREALRPLAEPSDASCVAGSLLAFVALDPYASALSVADRIRILSQLARECPLPKRVCDDIKLFTDRLMLAGAGVGSERAPSNDELQSWLDGARTAAYYRVSMEREDERAAFLGALARKVARDRRWQHASASLTPRAWVVASRAAGAASLILNETLWSVAVREFSPLPVASRIPHANVPSDAKLVLDEDTAGPMGVADAWNVLVQMC